MQDADILQFRSGAPFPAAQVLDLAVSVAIGRDLARSEDEMFALIENWFLRPATHAELRLSITRLLDSGVIERACEGDMGFCLTERGVEATTTLSGGMIRMIDRGRGYIKTAFLLEMLDLEKGKCP